MTRPDPGAVPERPHHISSIAHLYLQDEPAVVPAAPPVPSCSCAVASPQESPVSAFAAAALAHGLPGPSTLVEESRLRWSASSFSVPKGGGRCLVDLPDQSGLRRWSVTGGQDEAIPNSVVRWHHLGCLDSDRLAHLESLEVSRMFGAESLLKTAELFWCVLAGEVGRLGSAYTLGRAVELLRPGGLQILVFPDAWSRVGSPGWLDDIADGNSEPADVNSLLLFREMVDGACPGIRVRIRPVEGAENLTSAFGSQEEGSSLWTRMARRAGGFSS